MNDYRNFQRRNGKRRNGRGKHGKNRYGSGKHCIQRKNTYSNIFSTKYNKFQITSKNKIVLRFALKLPNINNNRQAPHVPQMIQPPGGMITNNNNNNHNNDNNMSTHSGLNPIGNVLPSSPEFELVSSSLTTNQNDVYDKSKTTQITQSITQLTYKHSTQSQYSLNYNYISDNSMVQLNSTTVNINKNSIVGAGSVITKNVKKKSLALTRAQQIEIKNYIRKKNNVRNNWHSQQ